MNKTLKRLFSSVLALAMILSTFGIVVSADVDKPTITVTEGNSSYMTTEDTPRTVKELVFNLKMPEGSDPVSAIKMTFSWDSSVISPVSITGSANYVDDPSFYGIDMPNYWSQLSYQEIVNGRPVVYTFEKNPAVVWAANDDGVRYGAEMSQYIVPTKDDGCDATSGVDFMKFYFVVNEGQTPDADTFAIETSLEDGTVLKNMYGNDPAEKILPVNITAGATSYVYGCPADTVADTATFSGFPYGNTKDQIDVSDVTIADVTKTYDGTAAEVVAPVIDGVTATVEYNTADGNAPVNAGTYTATLTLAATDAENSELVGDTELEATITISPKPVTFIVADVTKKANEATVFDGAFAEGDIVDGAEYTVVYSVDENNVISAVVTISDNYAVTYTTGTLTINAAKEDLPVVEGLSELEINGKIYKDLYKVNATIKEGFVGKTILNYGVKFRAMKDEEKVAGGADAVFTPGTEMVLNDAGLTFSAAVIGVPDGITVVAIPFVEFK